MMKKLLLLIFLFTLAQTQAQIVNIPDPNFKSHLVAYPGLDDNDDGEIQYSEAADFSGAFYLNGSQDNPGNIVDITGIEAFVNITHFIMQYQPVTSVDLSNNTLLEVVRIYDSEDLTSLNVSNCNLLYQLRCQGNNLNSLNISNCTALEEIFALDNQLMAIDLSDSPNLTTVRLENNNLSNVDFSNNTLLESIIISDNQLTSIDVDNLSELRYLSISNNQLTSLDVSNNTNLQSLTALYNQISHINVSNNPDLEILFLTGNPINGIDLSHNVALERLFLGGQFLTELDLSNNPAIYSLNVYLSQITELDLSNNVNLQSLSANTNYELEYLNLKNGNNEILDPQFTHVQATPSLQTVCVDDVNSSIAYEIGNQVNSSVSIIDDCETMDTPEFAVAGFSLYPNPAETIVNIQSSNPIVQVTVYNNLGQLVLEKPEENEIDINSLSKGLYFFKIVDSVGNSTTQKVVKN